jgi:hypothetical protein
MQLAGSNQKDGGQYILTGSNGELKVLLWQRLPSWIVGKQEVKPNRVRGEVSATAPKLV